MFNKEEIERLQAEKENLQSQLKVKSMEYQQLQEQYVHKNNELFDMISLAFNGFRRITEIAERNDYGEPQQKIRQMKEESEKLKNYFAQLTMDTPLLTKNRTNITDQSNK
ncbi:MAG: hypothetical protein IJ220_07670 [Clostridia bacterium]|nr:hypothetical protein [Clostridia bacterium]